MYLPKSQYKLTDMSELPGNVVALIDQAGEIVESTKKIVLTSFGTIFDTAGIDFDKGDFSKAKKLFIEKSDEDFDRDTEDNPTLSSDLNAKSLKLPPTLEDTKRGIMQRCFYYNKCTGKTAEISKIQLKNLALNKDNCTVLTKADWFIKGSAKDRTINGYFLEGLETVNNRTILQLKEIIPSIEIFLKSPLEYVQDTYLASSKEYTPQIKDIVIPSPGKKL
jgi:hypothetical protein|tara:strand:- start:3 stop:665 length:663 start_codon:yes stop_codon:yes gene_type:complete